MAAKDKAPTHEQKDAMSVDLLPGRTTGYTLARVELDPAARHGTVARSASTSIFSGLSERGGLGDHIDALTDVCAETSVGDLSAASKMLTAQAVTLNTLFTQLAARAQANMGEHFPAAETYMRLAFKAQAQSRATLEALIKMHQPREQTVRHIHVGPDGQAIFIENMHGGLGNVRTDERAHATGACQSADGTALLSHDPQRSGVPIAGSEREAPVPHARGQRRQRSTGGKRERV